MLDFWGRKPRCKLLLCIGLVELWSNLLAAVNQEMESWMQSLIGCGAVHLTPLELSLAPTYNKPYIYRLVKSLFELVPDDVDLEHRYICSLARRSAQQIEERAPTRRCEWLQRSRSVCLF